MLNACKINQCDKKLVGLLRLQNIVNVYTSARKRNDSV